MDLLKRFKKEWESRMYTQPGQVVMLAVSGGRDSMAMADLFLKCNVSVAVAHCNFGLRGAASDLDEELVRNWCKEHNVTCHVTRFDTKEKTIAWKKGTQETARILRYEWFEKIRREHGYAGVATAHHANDNVETLLINLLKGTGISGLHGILSVNENVIRPMLFATREMIDEYAVQYKVPFREDESNASDDYLRNAVRHKLIPVADELFPNVVENVAGSITRFAEAEMLYKKAVERERKKLIELRGKDYYIPIRKLRLREPLTTICYELLQPFGFSAAQAPHVIDLMEAETGRYVASPSHRVIRNRDFLVVTANPTVEADLILIEGAPCIVDSGQYEFSFSIQDKPKQISTDKNEAWLDMKGITFPILLRNRKTGDYLYPLGMKMKKKKVSRLLIDEKVPLHEKETVHILECNNRVAWVAGIRIDERYKIKETTERVLVVKRRLKTKG